MTNTPHDDEALREELAKAIWQVHSDNPREHILDGVMALISQKIIEAKIAENDYHWHHQRHITKQAGNGTISMYFLDRKAELEATLTTKQDTKEK